MVTKLKCKDADSLVYGGPKSNAQAKGVGKTQSYVLPSTIVLPVQPEITANDFYIGFFNAMLS